MDHELKIVGEYTDQVWINGYVWSIRAGGSQVAPNPAVHTGWYICGRLRARLWCWSHLHFGVKLVKSGAPDAG